MRVRSGYLRDQIILMFGKRQAVEVHPFTFPLISEHDCDIGALRQSRGGRRISA